MSGVEKWTCSCSHKEIGTIYFLRGAWGAIYGTSLLGVTSCFTDSNSSQKRKIHEGVNARHFTLQNHNSFYLDPPQTEPLDLSNKFKPASWHTTDSSGHTTYVGIDINGRGSATVTYEGPSPGIPYTPGPPLRTPANHLPNGSTRGTHHTGATSANDTGTPHYLSNGSTRGTHHTGATSANDT